MAAFEIYRYFWLKVTDEEGRSVATDARTSLHRSLVEKLRNVKAGGIEHAEIQKLRDMAIAQLNDTPLIREHSTVKRAFTMDVAQDYEHPPVSKGGVQMAIVTMPMTYTREESQAWITGPVGAAWSQGALAYQLCYSVVALDPLAQESDTAGASPA